MLDYLTGRMPQQVRATHDGHLQECSHCREIMALLARDTGSDSSPRPETAGALEVPLTLGRFRDLRLLGRGGMGVVYDAFDPNLQRRVALKVLHPERVGNSWRARLEAEARALASIDDLHVVTVYEVSRIGDDVYLAMELLPGAPLDAWLEADGADLARRIEVVAQAGRGLSAAHQAGLVHRDFKPSNVVVRELPDGPRATVIDFGLSTRDEQQEESTLPSVDSVVTATGALVGTPAYMAPEQLDRRVATARSDQFSFCVVLFEALTGRRPFKGASLAALRRAMVRRPALESLRQHGAPRRVATAILRGLSEEPGRRWPNMDALLTELRPARGAKGRVVGGVVLSCCVAGGVGAYRDAFVCGREAGAMGAIWNDQARASVRAATTADASSERAIETLDEYAAAWVDDAAAVCEAVSWREARRGPRGCLDEHVEAFWVVTDLLQRGPSPRPRALDLARTLRPSVDCRNVADVGHADTTTLAMREETARDLAQARALVDGGRTREAEPIVERVIASSSETQGPLHILALLTRGDLAYTEGEESAAADAWLDALTRARVAERPSLAVEAASRMPKVTQFAEADRWARLAIAEAERIDAPGLASLAHLSMARVWHDNDRAGAAREEMDLATKQIERLEAVPTLQEDLRLRRDTLEVQLLMQTAAVGAQRLQASVLRRTESSYGELHPKTAEAMVLYGLATLSLDDGEAAIGTLQAAVERSATVHGRGHLATAQALLMLGQAYKRFGSLEDARDATADAMRIYEARDDFDGLASTLRALGEIERILGDLATAETHQRAAIDAYRASAGAEHPFTAMAEISLSYTLMQRGEFDEATRLIDRASRLLHESTAPLIGGAIEAARGHLLLNSNRPAEAIAPYRRAVELFSAVGTTSRRLLKTRANLAKAYLEAGRVTEAASELRAARALEPEIDSFSNADDLGQTLTELEARVEAAIQGSGEAAGEAR